MVFVCYLLYRWNPISNQSQWVESDCEVIEYIDENNTYDEKD